MPAPCMFGYADTSANGRERYLHDAATLAATLVRDIDPLQRFLQNGAAEGRAR